jgi:HAD superfamily hydrolase (TIGR01662 family)
LSHAPPILTLSQIHMDIKAIFFDAGNTLVFIDPRVVLPILEEHGAQADLERFRRAELAARVQLVSRIEEGAFGTEPHIWQEYFVSLMAGSGVPEDRLGAVGDRIRDAHRESHLWTWFDPGTVPALQRLKDAGYRMAVISNADGRVEGIMETTGIRPFFEFVLDSELEGVEKPDPEIFLRACRRMGVEPEESLYVGDLYPVDVLGARKVGMHAVLLDPLGNMEYPVDCIPDVAALPAYLERVTAGT